MAGILKNVDLKKLSRLIRVSLREPFFVKQRESLNPVDTQKEIEELIRLLRSTKSQWRNSISNYEYMTDEEMIDYYTYEIKALEMRFKYLLKQAKEKGIKATVFKGL